MTPIPVIDIDDASREACWAALAEFGSNAVFPAFETVTL